MRIPIPYLEVCLLLNHESQTSCDTVYAAGKAVFVVLCSSIPDTDRMEIIMVSSTQSIWHFLSTKTFCPRKLNNSIYGCCCLKILQQFKHFGCSQQLIFWNLLNVYEMTWYLSWLLVHALYGFVPFLFLLYELRNSFYFWEYSTAWAFGWFLLCPGNRYWRRN